MNEMILFCAFRYALGRRTSAPSLVAEEIMKNMGSISAYGKRQMIKEIEDAQFLGDECDKMVWLSLKDALMKAVNMKEKYYALFSCDAHKANSSMRFKGFFTEEKLREILLRDIERGYYELADFVKVKEDNIKMIMVNIKYAYIVEAEINEEI